MSKTNYSIFIGLKVVTWVILIGLCIEAGSFILNFFFSIYQPDFVHNLYHQLDLSEMYDRSKGAFFGMYSLILSIALFKAYLFCILIRMMQKIDLAKPFDRSVAKRITNISYYTLAVGLLSYLAKQSAHNLSNRGFDIEGLHQFWADSQAFIIMAAVVYVISIIFSKGVDYQEELEETV